MDKCIKTLFIYLHILHACLAPRVKSVGGQAAGMLRESVFILLWMAILESKHFDHASFRHFNTELIYWKKCGLRRREDDGKEGFLVSGQMGGSEREIYDENN